MNTNFNQIVEESRASISKNDLKILFYIIKEAKNILEIGTWKGYSIETWYKAFNPDIAITIENDENIFRDNLNSFYEKIHYLLGKSQDDEIKEKVLRILKDELIDFLFIDGSHAFEDVKKDFEMYSSLVKKGGFIVLHDVVYTSEDPNSPVQVKKYWHEIRDQYDWIEIKSKDGTGMGIVRI